MARPLIGAIGPFLSVTDRTDLPVCMEHYKARLEAIDLRPLPRIEYNALLLGWAVAAQPERPERPEQEDQLPCNSRSMKPNPS